VTFEHSDKSNIEGFPDTAFENPIDD